MRGLPTSIRFPTLLLWVALAIVAGPCSRLAPAGETGPAAGPSPARREVRAIWVTRWDYQRAEDVRRIVGACDSLGMDRIIFQVRGQADAFYRSSLEPWGESLLEGSPASAEPAFDPLAIALEEAHRRGIELHAWLNVLPAWKGVRPPRSEQHLVHRHPEWFLQDRSGRRRILDAERYTILNPCLPAVRDHLRRVFIEVAERYAVDGVQLDYIRFLERDLARGEDAPYDPGTLESFRLASGKSPAEDPGAWDLFRQHAIDRLVASISSDLRRTRPGLRISVAAIRDRDFARSHLFQDAAAWVRNGWVDEVYPMAYERDAARFARVARSWCEAMPPERLVLGMGVHLLPNPREFVESLRWVRCDPLGRRASGFCLFAYSEFFPSRSKESRSGPAAESARSHLRAIIRTVNGVETAPIAEPALVQKVSQPDFQKPAQKPAPKSASKDVQKKK